MEPRTTLDAKEESYSEQIANYNKCYTEPFCSSDNSGKGNMILTKDIFLSLDEKGIGEHNHYLSRNANVCVIDKLGSMDAERALIEPNLSQANSSYIITDVEGRLYKKYRTFLKNRGYQIRCLDLVHTDKSNHYNPLKYIKTDYEIGIMLETLINSTNSAPISTSSSEQPEEERFWKAAESGMMTALIAYLAYHAEPEEKCLSTMMKLLEMGSIYEENESSNSQLDLLFEKLEKTEPDSYAVKMYRVVRDTFNTNVVKSVLVSIEVRLQALNLVNIRELTSTDDINLDTIGDEKTAVFVNIPADSFPVAGYLASLLYTQFLRHSYRYCDRTAMYNQIVYDQNGDVIKTFRADSEEESKDKAYKDANDFLGKAQNAIIKETSGIWNVVDSVGSVLLTRESKETAERALTLLKNGYINASGRRRLPVKVQLYMNDYIHTSIYDDMPMHLAVNHRYGITMVQIVNSIIQLQKMYPKNWEEIVGSCDSVLLIAGADVPTAEWFSKLAGYEKRKEGRKWIKIEALPARRIYTMSSDECVLYMKGLDTIYIGEKYDLSQHPNNEECSVYNNSET